MLSTYREKYEIDNKKKIYEGIDLQEYIKIT